MHYASLYALKPFSETEVNNPYKNLSLIDCIIYNKKTWAVTGYDYGNKVYPNRQSYALFTYSDSSILTSKDLSRRVLQSTHCGDFKEKVLADSTVFNLIIISVWKNPFKVESVLKII